VLWEVGEALELLLLLLLLRWGCWGLLPALWERAL
jgi:hypothetical protein